MRQHFNKKSKPVPSPDQQEAAKLVRSLHLTLAFYKARGEPETVTRKGTQEPIVTSVYDFSKAGDYYDMIQIPNINFSQPPKDFETRAGLNGISEPYRLPKGLTATEIQTWAMILCRQNDHGLISDEKMSQKMFRLYDVIEKMNPKLKKLAFDRHNGRDCYHTLLGIASGFRPRDIQFFRDIGGGMEAEKIKTYADRRHRLEAELGPMYWVPAPSTLIMIEHAAKKKAPPKPPGPK